MNTPAEGTPGWLKRAREKPSTVPSRRHVEAVIKRAQRQGAEITVASIATAANVDRAFIYRRPDLLAAIQASHGPTLSDDDTLGRKRSVNFSPNLETLTTEAAAAQDIPFGQYVRIAVTEKLARELGVTPEDLDGAKRPAPRRRNYSERNPKTSSKETGQ